ncbi:MAG TPA: hypothetical protein VN476_17255 [Pyrinomonadaceae bacterium]|nr:hypothetical protein [Pyrinomonadaceae bacterium]
MSGEAPFENDHSAGEFVLSPEKSQTLGLVENIVNEVIAAYPPAGRVKSGVKCEW